MSNQKERQNACDNIRYLRRKHGLSRTAMARKLHVTVKTLDSLEAGLIPPRISITFLYYIHREFGISPEQLLRVRLEEAP